MFPPDCNETPGGMEGIDVSASLTSRPEPLDRVTYRDSLIAYAAYLNTAPPRITKTTRPIASMSRAGLPRTPMMSAS